MNKHEYVSEYDYGKCLDHVFNLNLDTPNVKYYIEEGIKSDLIFGLDTKLFINKSNNNDDYDYDKRHHYKEIDIIKISINNNDKRLLLTLESFEMFLKQFKSEFVYRIKGIVYLNKERFIINWAFGYFL